MTLLFIIGLILGFYFIRRMAAEKDTGLTGFRCPKQHRWRDRGAIDDGKHYLVCEQCGKYPGED